LAAGAFLRNKFGQAGLVVWRNPTGETSMIMETHPWLLPAWLIGAPFVLGLIEYMSLPKPLR
jgi:hypothetical protein